MNANEKKNSVKFHGMLLLTSCVSAGYYVMLAIVTDVFYIKSVAMGVCTKLANDENK